jgi:transposase-like protein
MGTGRTDEFRKDAVRIALTSGLSRRQVADDLGPVCIQGIPMRGEF